MAEVSQSSGGGRGKHKSGPKQKKKSTRIDMTAMVDVAFLLLTFFILTTTLANPKAMQVVKPPKDKEDEKAEKDVAESKIMTLILGKDDKVHFYYGITEPVVETTNFSNDGVRKKILDFIKGGKDGSQKGSPLCSQSDNAPKCWDPIFVIKPTEKSKFKNMVDILDEMKIVKAPKYALAEITPADSAIMVGQNIPLK